MIRPLGHWLILGTVVFLLLLSIELRQFAQVGLQLIILGIGGLATGTLHHEATEDGEDQDAEGEVKGPRALGSQEEVGDGGTEDEDI